METLEDILCQSGQTTGAVQSANASNELNKQNLQKFSVSSVKRDSMVAG